MDGSSGGWQKCRMAVVEDGTGGGWHWWWMAASWCATQLIDERIGWQHHLELQRMLSHRVKAIL